MLKKQDIDKFRAVSHLKLVSDSVPPDTVIHGALYYSDGSLKTKQPKSIMAYPDNVTGPVFLAYKYDGIFITIAYEAGKVYFIFRDGSVYSFVHKFNSTNFIASAEFCSNNKLVITDFFFRDSKCLGQFLSRQIYVSGLATAFQKNTTICAIGQEFYAPVGFFLKYNENDLEEGVIVHLGFSSYYDNDPGIYKWKKASRCTVDLMIRNGVASTSDKNCFKTNYKLDDGIYEFDLKGNLVSKCVKKHANSAETVNGVLYNSFFNYDDFKLLMDKNERKEIIPHMSILAMAFKKKDPYVIKSEESTWVFSERAEDKDLAEYDEVEERFFKKIRIPRVACSNGMPVKVVTETADDTETIFIPNADNLLVSPVANPAILTNPRLSVNVAAYEKLRQISNDAAKRDFEKLDEDKKFVEICMWTTRISRVRRGTGADSVVIKKRIISDVPPHKAWKGVKVNIVDVENPSPNPLPMVVTVASIRQENIDDIVVAINEDNVLSRNSTNVNENYNNVNNASNNNTNNHNNRNNNNNNNTNSNNLQRMPIINAKMNQAGSFLVPDIVLKVGHPEPKSVDISKQNSSPFIHNNNNNNNNASLGQVVGVSRNSIASVNESEVSKAINFSIDNQFNRKRRRQDEIRLDVISQI